MCERTIVGSALVLALAVGAPAGAAARQAGDGEAVADLVARIDSLRPLVAEASRRADRADSVREAREIRERAGALDTVVTGPLVVVTPARQAELARDLFGRSWEEEFRWLGAAAARAVGRWTFAFQYGSADEIVTIALPSPARSVEGVRFRDRGRIEGRVRDAVRSAVTEALPVDVRTWTDHAPLRAPRDWSRIHRRLVLTPNRLARACWAGDLDACWRALGAVPTGDPWRDWYAAQERRELVRDAPPWTSREQPALRSACLEQRSDPACLDYLSVVVGRAGFPPLHSEVRSAFLWFVLEQGGDGALDRLVDQAALDHGGIEEAQVRERAVSRQVDLQARFARVARVGPDELMSRWHQRVMEARPDRRRNEKHARLTASLWILLFTVFATRSTRWR